MKKTWRVLNKIIKNNCSNENFPEYFNINNEKVNDKQKIANSFNKFFVEIGPNLSSSIPLQDKTILDYMTKS